MLITVRDTMSFFVRLKIQNGNSFSHDVVYMYCNYVQVPAPVKKEKGGDTFGRLVKI